MTGRRIAVVGAGMAAARFAERYDALGGRDRIVLYGAEARTPYNRVLLADVLTGRYDAEAIGLPTGAAQVRIADEVCAVDTTARTLTLHDGRTEPWDDLVFATGANPVLPPIRGLLLPHGGGLHPSVHAVRTLADCARLADAATGARRAVVIGGGVLGVSVARALATLGLDVEIVHQAPHLIERQLDAEAAAALRAALGRLGVETYLLNRARALTEHGEVELAGGHRLDTDLVVLACGVRPRTALARASGLHVDTGIRVDDALATSAPHVHAIGDCVQHRGSVHGLAGPAWEQADVLAARLSGADPHARHTGSRPLARLSAPPVEYAAFGEGHRDNDDLEADPALHILRLADATRGSYKKLVLRGNRLVGAILVGDLATVGDLTRACAPDAAVPETPLHLITDGVRP
ncbi:NAD(P)/FAD-dependent oxidoreductase [Streptomyces tropicalis]|uniref:FAD-dependent oxidoreductase n=1 Tax=Streptomyces tropicalis TaxID=3034234 RepID=A0ABT6A354_9ACTN|nr:FAD-dependent oxidoreductase [Streptomyces tropicalis]MDF3298878.1 FAD-dependent oxidoreductase [Streptomyces tropicalis]